MFYCTAGRGTEVFVAQELSSRSIDNIATVTDGKVYFKCDKESFHKLKQLRSVERVFVQIEHCKSSDLHHEGRDRYDLMNSLKERLIKQEHLRECLHTYRAINEIGKEQDSDSNEPLCKRPRMEDEREDMTTFRVSSKVAGKWRKLFRGRNFQELSQHLGRDIVQKLGWSVELRNPDFEICVHVNDTTVCAGIPITRQPVSKRDYIVKPGLRSTVSWILSHLADIQAGDVVLDPMCGKSTILVEAGMECKNCHFLGFDLDPYQLKDTASNRESTGLESTLSMGLADVTCLALRDACVDKVVCDAPFGQKHSISMDVTEFYRLLLHQIHRVLRPGGLCVLMTSAELKATVRRLTCRGSGVKSCSPSDAPDLGEQNKLASLESTDNQPSEDTAKETTSSTDPKVETDSMRDQSESTILPVTPSCEETTAPEAILTSDSMRNQSESTIVPVTPSCEETTAPEAILTSDSMRDQSESTIVPVTPSCEKTTAPEAIFTSDSLTQTQASSHIMKGSENHVESSIVTEPQIHNDKMASVDGPSVTTIFSSGHTRTGSYTEARGSKDSELEAKKIESRLAVSSEHYIKLGETHACIFVLKKEK